MARGSFPKGPNYVHPERDSAVGSRNSMNRDGRNEYAEAKLIIDEEVDKILNHVSNKLPPEVLEKLHVGGSIKEVLHNYYNQSYQNMYNRYITTVEDEMGKKFRDLVDEDEAQNLNKYNPRDISFLLDSIGKEGMFNTHSVENSIVNIWGHLQGHVQKGTFDLEDETRKMLSGKSGVGGFLRGEFSGSIVKCSFSNNPLKPDAVTDVNLVINIPEPNLNKPIYHYQVATENIIRDIISEHILQQIDKEIDSMSADLTDAKSDDVSHEKKIFEKIKKLDEKVSSSDQSADSPQYNHVAKKFLDAIKGIGAEVDFNEFDPLDTRENVLRIVNDENIRDRGFNDATNKLVGLLDVSNLGYQHIENFKNCRKIEIREYEDKTVALLPDEHYQITVAFLDDLQLREIRTAFCQQLDDFAYEAEKLNRVFEKIYLSEKTEQGFKDYEDVAAEILGTARRIDTRRPAEEDLPRAEIWDEITFVAPEKNDMDKLNESFLERKKHLLEQYRILREKLAKLYENDNPSERIIMEQRLDFLEEETQSYLQSYNPFQVYPGLFVEVSLSSINRRDQTLSKMGNVLTQFLEDIAKDIPDYAHEEYHQQRVSHERADAAFSSSFS